MIKANRQQSRFLDLPGLYVQEICPFSHPRPPSKDYPPNLLNPHSSPNLQVSVILKAKREHRLSDQTDAT